MEERTFTFTTELFGTVTGTRSQLKNLINIIEDSEDRSWHRSIDSYLPAVVRDAWKDYCIELVQVSNKINLAMVVDIDEV